jgi:hypothetical protein
MSRCLANLALESRDLGLVIDDGRRLDLVSFELSAIEQRQPKLDQVRRKAISLLGFAATEHARSDVLAELQLEPRSMVPVGTS